MLRVVVVGAATTGAVGLGLYSLRDQPVKIEHDNKACSLPPLPNRSEQVIILRKYNFLLEYNHTSLFLTIMATVCHSIHNDTVRLLSNWSNKHLTQLKNLREREFDVLVIGGGATGAGCVLDAQTRGLNAALVERGDFSSGEFSNFPWIGNKCNVWIIYHRIVIQSLKRLVHCKICSLSCWMWLKLFHQVDNISIITATTGTSSRSTKLIHGGIRYLQNAIFNVSYWTNWEVWAGETMTLLSNVNTCSGCTVNSSVRNQPIPTCQFMELFSIIIYWWFVTNLTPTAWQGAMGPGVWGVGWEKEFVRLCPTSISCTTYHDTCLFMVWTWDLTLF